MYACANVYSSENIIFPNGHENNSQGVIDAQKEDLLIDGESPTTNALGRAPATNNNAGSRLYVGNISYAATVEDLREFFKGFSL